MDKSRRTMDVVSPQRLRQVPSGAKISRRHIIIGVSCFVGVVVIGIALLLFLHRNDQRIMTDRYQVVYLVTGQIYFGKLQNKGGQYLTLRNVYTVENQTASSNSTTGSVTTPSKILKVSQQVYGPDDSMAIRADQVQFWQNLRSDSKVVKAIESSPAQ